MKKDYSVLADMFSLKTKSKAAPKCDYEFNGRKARIEISNGEWSGYFTDDHSVEYSALTKRELLADMEGSA